MIILGCNAGHADLMSCQLAVSMLSLLNALVLTGITLIPVVSCLGLMDDFDMFLVQFTILFH